MADHRREDKLWLVHWTAELPEDSDVPCTGGVAFVIAKTGASAKEQVVESVWETHGDSLTIIFLTASRWENLLARVEDEFCHEVA